MNELKLWLSSALLAVGAGSAYVWFSPANWFLFTLGGALLTCAVALHSSKHALALAVRGVMWSVVTMSVFAAQMYGAEGLRRANHAPMVTALVCCGALLLVGHARSESATFRPLAYHRILTTGILLAVADVLAFTLFSIVGLIESDVTFAIFGGGVAAVSVVGIVGLYQLRTWGLLVSVLVNLFVIVVAGTDALHLHEFRIVFLVPACVQLLLFVPWFISAVGKRPVVVPAWLAGLGRMLPAATIVGMMALAVQPRYGRPVFELVFRWLSR
jgi:hypothetical protein